jgi:tryptophan-rich sensory protein
MPLTVAQIRIIAGVLAVIVLFIIIWRRKRKASE